MPKAYKHTQVLCTLAAFYFFILQDFNTSTIFFLSVQDALCIKKILVFIFNVILEMQINKRLSILDGTL